MRTRFWLALGLAVGGLAMVVQVWRGGWLDGIGLLAGLGAALALASYYLFSERGVGRRDPLSLTFWAFVVASTFWNTFRPVWELELGSTGRSVSLLGALANVELPLWSLLLWIVVVGTVVPFVLTVAALRHLSATAAIVVEMLEPVGAAVLGWAWFGESLAALQVTGGVAVLVGIVLAQTARRPSPALLTQ